jgi:hypothetical protein
MPAKVDLGAIGAVIAAAAKAGAQQFQSSTGKAT